MIGCIFQRRQWWTEPNSPNTEASVGYYLVWFGKILLNHKKTIENYKSKRNVAQKCYKIGKTMVYPYIHILSDSVTIPKLRYSFFWYFPGSVDYGEKATLIGKKCDMLLTYYDDSFFFTNCCMYKYRYIVTK